MLLRITSFGVEFQYEKLVPLNDVIRKILKSKNKLENNVKP